MRLLRAFLVLLFALPLVASAATTTTTGAVQNDAALRSSIQAALLSDPRTDSLPPDQLNALITALAADATAHNIKPTDISYIPRPTAEFAAVDTIVPQTCDIWCSFATAYDLNTATFTSPVFLVAAPLVLLLVSWLLIMIIRRALRPEHHEHFTGVPDPDVAPQQPPKPQPYV